MSEPLPTRNFNFLSPKEIEEFDMSKTAATDDVRFILEVDFKYPIHLNESHNDYLLAAVKIKITHDMLSPYSQSLINNHSSTEKLAPNLNDKIKYVLHYEIFGCTWNWEWNLLEFTEFFISVSRLGSNRVLILIQRNENRLRRPFCKTCSSFS